MIFCEFSCCCSEKIVPFQVWVMTSGASRLKTEGSDRRWLWWATGTSFKFVLIFSLHRFLQHNISIWDIHKLLLGLIKESWFTVGISGESWIGNAKKKNSSRLSYKLLFLLAIWISLLSILTLLGLSWYLFFLKPSMSSSI